MIQTKLQVSGYRGIWGENLTEEIASKYALAFIEYIKEKTNKKYPTILIGRDGRESGPIIKKAIINKLEKQNVKIIDGDVLPTPTVLYAVRTHKYDGAIIITASHNPIEYNGLKFVMSDGFFTNENDVKNIIEKYNQINIQESKTKLMYKIKNILQVFKLTPNFVKEHADHILKNIDTEKIRAKKFKVAVDMTNGASCVMDPYLFEQLGIQLLSINNIPNGKFTHKPEPLKENLEQIEKFVKENKVDIGFVQDPDADRLVVIDEHGEMISEEYTVSLGMEAILAKYPNTEQTIVINMSTSQMNTDIAHKYGGECIRAKVGEANVVSEMLKVNAIAGGEGGGGVIYPTINFARDSFVSLCLILELLAKNNKSISETVKEFPKYHMKKDKITITDSLENCYKKLKEHFKEATANELDGLRLDFADSSWIHLRPSNTEPIIRLYGEAKEKIQIENLFTETKKILL